MKKGKLVIWGIGGHAGVVLEAAEAAGLQVVAFIDNVWLVIKEFKGIKVVSACEGAEIGELIFGFGDLKARWTLSKNWEGLFGLVVHPRATISSTSLLGEGTFVGAGAVVNAGACVGLHCIVNTNAVVEHDCMVSSCCHVASGAVLCGGVTVGRGTLIGANATVLPRIKIGAGVIVGAGAVVTKDAPDNSVVLGNVVKKGESC